MLKRILIVASLLSSAYAMDYGDSKVDAWRDGFITSYKAMEVDTQIQGLKSSPLKLNQYIIYFDANKEDVATWDKLMIQMFGYTSSVTKPIRTTNNWVIFSSYDNKASAVQEMEVLNQKIFKNSKEYKLQLFDNKEGRVFSNAIALLASHLKELEAIMLEHNKIELEKEKQKLEENQKVAVIYVNSDGKIIERRKPPIIEKTPDAMQSKAKEVVAPKNMKMTKKTSAEDTTKEGSKKTILYAQARKNGNTIVFSKPMFDLTYKVRNAEDNELFEIYEENTNGWSQIKDKNEYVAFHTLSIMDKKKFLSLKKQGVKREEKKPLANSNHSEKAVGSFTITRDKTYSYKITNYSPSKSSYALEEIEAGALVNNPFTDLKYSKIVTDSEGGKYIKLLNKQQFFSFEDVALVN